MDKTKDFIKTPLPNKVLQAFANSVLIDLNIEEAENFYEFSVPGLRGNVHRIRY